MITSDSSTGDEQPIQTGVTLDPYAPFVLESIHDEPYVAPNPSAAIEISSTDILSSSNQIGPQIITTIVSPPPTLLLDSTILKEVCDNILKDQNKLVKTINNFVHAENYEEKWTALRERVDIVMCEVQKLSIEAYKESINTLNI